MVETFDEFIGAALSMSPGDRAMLADQLLDSLDAPNQEEIDRLWAEEAEKRVKEIDEGKVQPISGEEVMKELRNRASNSWIALKSNRSTHDL
tara:strand:+ start:151 stop:426 length:276 start_codon:yes stop_codon:yes gene_type:complete